MMKLKRVYEKPTKTDGFRILVDRLWPRGLSKQKAKVDLWFKEIAPSYKLRKWFGHKESRWNEFQKRYKRELRAHKEALKELQAILKKHRIVTLLYATSNKKHNNAVVLKEFLGR